MRAILRKSFGGPEVLYVTEHPAPEPRNGFVLIEVKAFGLNHAELYMRSGNWPEAAPISGIEVSVSCARARAVSSFRDGK